MSEPKSTQTDPPSIPAVAAWLYDQIMQHLEPDLMLACLPMLAEKYKDETQEQRMHRMESYDRAFRLFDEIAKDVTVMFREETQTLRRDARNAAQGKEEHERSSNVIRIESIIDQADA
jgi:hypothetical protein